jgi:pimeloyl-ACP methyl ester carboxylesterase
MRAAGNLGNVPLIVLTGGRTFARASRDAAANAEAQRAWNSLQADLARLSTRGRQVIVENSGHMMQYDAPHEISRAIREIIEEVQSDASAISY